MQRRHVLNGISILDVFPNVNALLVWLRLTKEQDHYERLIQYTMNEQNRHSREITALEKTLDRLGIQLPENKANAQYDLNELIKDDVIEEVFGEAEPVR